MNYRYLLYSLLVVVLISCTGKKHKAVVKGVIESARRGDVVLIEELGIKNPESVDSARIKSNGRFRLDIPLENPGFYKLSFRSGPLLTLILTPGEEIRITADMQNFYGSKKIEGSYESSRVNDLQDSLRKTIIFLNTLNTAYDSLSTAGDDERSRLEKEFQQIRKNYNRFSKSFILADLKSLANITALYQEYQAGDYVFYSARDLQFFKLVSDSLKDLYANVRMVKMLNDNYNSMMSEYNLNKIMSNPNIKLSTLPDLDLPGADGKNISLSSVNKKFVLVSFWSVGHEESVENMLELKRIYSKYKKLGFEVYQVSIDKSLSRWKKALAFEELTWINVCDTAFPSSATKVLFNVTSIPMSYLIDKEKEEIVAKNLSPAALDKHLNNYFTKNTK